MKFCGEGKMSCAATRMEAVTNSMALVPLDCSMDVEDGRSTGEESAEGSDYESSDDAAMVDAHSPIKQGMALIASSAKINLDSRLELMDAATPLRAGASMDTSMTDCEENGRRLQGVRPMSPKKTAAAVSAQGREFQCSAGVRANDPSETVNANLGAANLSKLGAAPNPTHGRKWSDVAGNGHVKLTQSDGMIAIPPSSDPEAFDSVLNTVRLCDESRELQYDRFEAALVGRLFGRRLPYAFLRDELYKRWEKFGNFRMITAGPDCFMCLFDDTNARDHVLMGGPWIVAGQVIGVDRWSPQFSPTSEIGFITPVWVRLPGLPFDCWELENLARILEAIGTPLWMDAATARLDRGSFERACVKINLAKPLSAGLWLEDRNGKFHQPLLYEGLSMFCHKCECVGHRESACPSDVETAPPSVITTNGKSVDVDPSTSLQQILKAGESLQHGENSLPRGDWMIVGRRRRNNGENREAVRKASAMGKQGAAGDGTMKGMNGLNKFHYLQKNENPGAETNVDEGSVSGEGRAAHAEPSINSPMKQVHSKSSGKKENAGSLSQLGGSCEHMKSNTKNTPTAVVQQVVQYAEPCLTPMVFACAEMVEPLGKRAKKARGRDRFSPLTITTLAANIAKSFEKSEPYYKSGDSSKGASDDRANANRKSSKYKESGDSSSLVNR